MTKKSELKYFLMVVILLVLPIHQVDGLIQLENYVVKDSDGNSVNLMDFRGNITLLDTMTSVCETCELQNKYLKQLYDAAPNLTIVSISVDPIIDDVRSMAEYKQKFKLPWMVAIDEEGSLQDIYQISNYPNIFLFDTTGNLIERWNNVVEATEVADVLEDYIPVDEIEDNGMSVLLNKLISNPLFLVVVGILVLGIIFTGYRRFISNGGP